MAAGFSAGDAGAAEAGAAEAGATDVGNSDVGNSDVDGAEADAAAAEVVHRAAGWRADLLALADDDATAYTAVLRAESADERRQAFEQATEIPLRIAEVARDIAGAAGELATGGRHALRGDAQVAALLAAAAASAAAHLVRCNVRAGQLDPSLLDRAETFVSEAERAAARAGRPA